jgi:hypothetical protein|tara:strand:+ start:42 stop:392 length:351 start_codon:yes stop_codon:yes gene_type:complete
MKRTEEVLLKIVKEEVELVTNTLRDELANRILEEVCKKALVEAGAHAVQFYDPHETMFKPEFRLNARDALAEAAERKARVQIKIEPNAKLREPLLLDIKEMINKELNIRYPSGGKK